jgi:exoribonuclease R
MIEELMLLANMTVAEYLHKQLAYQPALLRRHPPPNGAQLGHLVHTLKILGHEVDASSSQALNEALTAMRTRDPIAFSVITFLFARPMKVRGTIFDHLVLSLVSCYLSIIFNQKKDNLPILASF